MRAVTMGLIVLCMGGCDVPTEGNVAPATDTPAAPEVLAVNWLARGALYAGRVVDRRGAFTRVQYADGDNEWVDASRIQPWPELTGRRVQYHTGVRTLNVTVQETQEGLLHVALEEGGDTWISPDMLYRLEAPGPAGGDGAPRAFPVRMHADPGEVLVGRFVLAYWISGGEIQRNRPWRARVTARTEDRVHLAYIDGSEGDLPISAVLRVFEAGPVQPAVGERYWLQGENPIGTLLETRSGLSKFQVGTSEQWLDDVGVIDSAPLVDASRLEPGVHVTALWSGSSLYHGTVVSVSDDSVTLAWHDGSEPSAVAVTDVLEIWQPTGETPAAPVTP